MVQINFGQREVSCKVVFYGPGVSGKTTNLEIIHKKAPKDAVGEMVSIATESDRTLYFDFLPLDLGQVAGMRTKFQLYTVPGQIYYNATRKLVLQGVDGVIFVADSNPDKMAENLESLQNLRDNLAEMGLTVDDIPVVLQYNKRDLPNALPVAELDAMLNPAKMPTFEAVAREGKGVFATLKEVSRLVIEKLNKENAPAAGRRRTANSLTPQQSTSVGTPGGSPSIPPATPSGLTPVVPKSVLPANPPARPAPAPAPIPQAAPVAPPQGARPAPSPAPSPAPRPALVPRPGAPAPAPVAEDPKAKHLQKPKPPALDARGVSPVSSNATDPSLRKYQDARVGGNPVKGLLIALVSLVVIFILLVVLILFVKPVRDALRPLFPPGIQRVLMDEAPVDAPSSAPAPVSVVAPAAIPTSTVTPAPASAPAAPPAGKPADAK